MKQATVMALGVVLLWGGAELYAGHGVDVSGGKPDGGRCPVIGSHPQPAGVVVGSAGPAYAPVAPTGVTIVVPDEQATIQGAIDAAMAGDTVLVRAGVYFEHVLLGKQLTLLGEDCEQVIVDGEGAGTVLQVTASGVDVQGFTFQNSGTDYEAHNAGVILSSVEGVHVAHCRFVNNSVGVYPCNVARSVFEKCVFQDNERGLMTDFDYSAPDRPGSFNANRILNNVFNGNGNAIGFSAITESDQNVVRGNVISESARLGIAVAGSDANDFSYNTLLNNSGYGIYLSSGFDNQIHHNNFIGNDGGWGQAYSSPSLQNHWCSPHDGVGNFWSDYKGADGDQDGLGDSPYVIPERKDLDAHPLMHRFVPGDMNLDGVLNAFDIDPFVLGLTNATAYQAQFLQPPALLGDCNFDGRLDVFDIDAFVYWLTHAGELPIPPNQPPLVASNPTPADGFGAATSPCVNWSGVDPDIQDTLVYDVYFEASNPEPSVLVASGQADDYWCTGGLRPGTTYYWQVVARDNHGAETRGPVWHFDTAPAVWFVEPVLSDLASDPAIVVDSSGVSHVSGCASGSVHYATWTASGWDSETVSPGRYGLACALDGNDVPHLSYYDVYGGVRHAWWTGSEWATERVYAEFSMATAIALDTQNRPRLAYVGGSTLKYAAWNGSAWVIETVGPCDENQVALALDSADQPHIFYGEGEYAFRSGGSWMIETVYSHGLDCGGLSLALDSAGRPHVTFTEGWSRALNYAIRTGSGWSVEMVSAAGQVSWDTCLRLDALDHPHIACYASGAPYGSGLVYVAKSESVWQTESIDTSQIDGYVSLAFDKEGRPVIAYGRGSEVWFATRVSEGPGE